MKNKICAIHQPNFFPWLGYFDKIKKCDKFVVLDDVQLQKKGASWSNRAAINIQGQKKWITAPINRPSGVWNINETSFQKGKWRDKLIKTLQANYSKSPNFKKHKRFVFDLINFESDNLAEYNLNAIIGICSFLRIDVQDKVVLSSDFAFNSTSNQLLIDLTKAVGCDTYMAGGGAGSYQNLIMFDESNLNFMYQNFEHPIYLQKNVEDFIQGLSAIDYIFNSENNMNLDKGLNG